MSGGTRSGGTGRAAFGRRLALAAALAALAFLVAQQFLGMGTLPDGTFAPELSLPRADRPGERLELARLRAAGKVVVLDFWSTTCAPCLSQMKALDALQRRMGARGVQVVGVCAGGEPVGEVASFLERHGAAYPVAVDEDGAATAAYRVRSLPTLYVIDREGRVAASHVGFWPEGGVAGAVAGALESR